jgi:5-methyltetrahydrofolate--homocysteine methyltransferase
VIEANKDRNKNLPIMVSVTLEQNGTMLLGSDLSAVATLISNYPVFSIGINCSLGPDMMEHYLSDLRKLYKGKISCIPNAGLPTVIDGKFVYSMTPQHMADIMASLVKRYDIDIIGGCCGTTYDHIKEISKKISGLKPNLKTEKSKIAGAVCSLYTSVSLKQDPPPTLIGERANANGSKAFRELILKEDFDGMVKVAKDQEGMSHLIDVCVAYAGLDEVKYMSKLVFLLNQKLTAPIVIDSTDENVILEALKRYAGKPVINSINLEDGGKKLYEILNIVKKFPAAVIALTIDENGMAMDVENKFNIAKRIYDIWTKEYNLPPEDLIFDPLTFSIGSGDKSLRFAALETLKAINEIKTKLPGVKTVLGVSNVSFGLSPDSRTVLNSVFLSRAVKVGLDLAIVNPAKIIPETKIGEKELILCNNLIDGKEGALNEFINFFSTVKATDSKISNEKLSDEELLEKKLIDGEKENIEQLLNKLLEKYKPVEIINNILMPGMQKIGELFGSGKMLLPFVLQSAEVMKKSVNYLEKFMEKKSDETKGKVVLATVKGDVHDIGKNLVEIILSNNGYEVYNLGIKVEASEMIKKAKEVNATAIGMSGLLVKSTIVMKENIQEIKENNLNLKVLLGGAALTKGFVDNECAPFLPGKVYYCRDAFDAIKYLSSNENSEDIDKRDKKGTAILSNHNHERIDRTSKLKVTPPFIGYKIVKEVKFEDFKDFINKYTLINTRWGFKKGELSESEYNKILKEAIDIYNDMIEKIEKEGLIEPKVSYGYFYCKANKNNLIVYNHKEEMVETFYFPRQKISPYLCISDYFDDRDFDILPLQVVTIGEKPVSFCKELNSKYSYKEYFLYHGLFTEITEALAEYWHFNIRSELNILTEFDKSIESILRLKYQGRRYSFGYPACPDLEENATLGRLLHMHEIGVSLTETYLMVPEFSTSAIVVYNEKAEYFVI